MKTKLAAIVISLIGAVALPAIASDAVPSEIEKTIQLKDGGSLHIFKDGKMAKESKFGRAEFIAIGQTLETSDGQSVTVNSNEVARLGLLIKKGHRN